MNRNQFNPQQFHQMQQMQAMQQMQMQQQAQMLQELQLKEAIELMGMISKRCFKKCITKFDTNELDGDEDKCLKRCGTKSIKFNEQLSQHYQKYSQTAFGQQ